MTYEKIFSEYRNLLFTIAYNMMGIVEDAEDLVQETYTKWSVLPIDEIRAPKAFLVKIITNLSINQLNTARKIREGYIGLWLPEPLLKEKVLDSSNAVDLYYSLSIGMMVLLEKLTPPERAVFLLKEVFSYDYTEIADITEKSKENCRQIFNRAKKHLGGKEKRFKVDIKIHEKLLQQFLTAVKEGNMEGLFSLLKEDIELIADGGGKLPTFGSQKFSTSRKPVTGQKNVSKFLLSITEKVNNNVPNLSNKIVYANGVPSVVISSNDVPVCLMSLEIVDDKISNIFVRTNPEKIKNI